MKRPARASARKSKRKPASPRRRPPGRRATILKIVGGLTLVAALVVGAGLALRHWFPAALPTRPETAAVARPDPPARRAPRPAPEAPPPRAAAPEPPPRPAPEPKAASTPEKQPVYEVFPPPQEAVPPAAKPVAPPPGPRPRVAIIIDDIGYDRSLVQRFLSLDADITFALLPFSPFQQSIVEELRRAGREIMLHLPMEPVEYPRVDPGPGALLDRMQPDELIAQLERNLDSLPGVRGVNNHMGSRLTAQSTRMYQIFSVLKKRGLFFIDSRSTAATVGEPSARLFQLPFAERDIFLDHVVEAKFIRGQFRRLVQEARRQGQAVAIGHPHDLTVRILAEQLPHLKGAVELVPASAIVKVPGGA